MGSSNHAADYWEPLILDRECDTLTEEHVSEVTKALKAQWEELADDKKQPYLDKEAQLRKKYSEECKAAGIETLEEKKAKKDAEKAAKKAEKDAERKRKKAQKV